jgi:transcriptional regulator with XRE-family HTH domain
MLRRMKLSDYMINEKITPEDMAARMGNASASGIIKWMRDERVPRPDQQRRIFDVTGGAVTPNDFILRNAPSRRNGHAA